MACISIYLFLICIVQFSENRQIKIQRYDMSRQFSRHHCRNKKTFSSNGYYNEILNLNGSINTSKELLTKKKSLKYYYKILHSSMVNIHEFKLPLNLRFIYKSFISICLRNIWMYILSLYKELWILPQIEYRILHP